MMRFPLTALLLYCLLSLPGLAADSSRQSAMTPEVTAGSTGGPRLGKLHYTNSSGEKGESEFFYDAAGRVVSSTWKQLDGARSSRNIYVHDGKGRVTEKWRIFSEGRSSLEEFSWSPEGFLVRETYKRSDGRKGHANYTRAADGRILYVDCHGLSGWFRGGIVYSYDTSGRLSGGELRRQGKKLGEIQFEHDAEGRLNSETWAAGKWTQTFTFEFHRKAEQTATWSSPFISEHSASILKEEYSWCGKAAGPSFYTYNARGLLVGKRFIRADGLTTETTYTYSPNGLLTRSIRSYSNGKTGTFTYKYKNRLLVERIFRRSDGVTGRESYTWDHKGRLTGGEWENFDGWITGSLAITPGPDGRPRKAVFKGSDATPDATVTFNHDSRGNLTRIHWEFTDGKTQTYQFLYPD